MKKRLFSIITALALCLSLLPATALAASDSGSYVFDISEGKVTIIDGDTEGKIYKLLSFTGSGRDVADPWYTGDFDATYADVDAGCKALLEYVLKDLADKS